MTALPLLLALAAQGAPKTDALPAPVVRWAAWLRAHTPIAETKGWTRATWEVEPPERTPIQGYLSPSGDRVLDLNGFVQPYERLPEGPQYYFEGDGWDGYRNWRVAAILLGQGREEEARRLAATLFAGEAQREIEGSVRTHALARYARATGALNGGGLREGAAAAQALLADLPSLRAVWETDAPPRDRYDRDPLGFLEILPLLADDLQRRLDSPLPKLRRSLRELSPSEIVARLEDLTPTITTVPGGNRYDDAPEVRELVSRGEAAVPALLDAVERDRRLTRMVYQRNPGFDIYVTPVAEVARTALRLIAGLYAIPGETRKDGTRDDAAFRRFFTEMRGKSPAQRSLALLEREGADDTLLLGAAGGFYSPAGLSAGERARAVALLDARLRAEMKREDRRFGLALAAALALARAELKPEGAGELLALVTEAARGSAFGLDPGVAAVYAKRIERGDAGAESEYTAWIEEAAVPAGERRDRSPNLDALLPLKDVDKRPGLLPLLEWVFRDPASPFRTPGLRELTDWRLRLGPEPKAVRREFLRELEDRTRIGSVKALPNDEYELTFDDGGVWRGSPAGGEDLGIGDSQVMRRCDVIARVLSPSDFPLRATLARRDAAIEGLREKLRIGLQRPS